MKRRDKDPSDLVFSSKSVNQSLKVLKRWRTEVKKLEVSQVSTLSLSGRLYFLLFYSQLSSLLRLIS